MSVLPSLGSVQFVLGATVYAYEDGRVDTVSWGEHGGIGLVGLGGLRRLGEDEQETTA
ncbi:hypothetical protein [Halococcus sp. AFM35]|uniref:hypothetical protein n=1 Tax=Halococcus sp. AFM35 TaxID=3421653 RepID=UPI003EBB116C